MKLFTIGFTKKSAREFFTILKKNKVSKIVDIRRNNTSQLSGFTKARDFKFFLNEILGINYMHLLEFAPHQKLLKQYRNKQINWDEFEIEYIKKLEEYKSWDNFNIKKLESGCLLCSESKPDKCHRRILAEYLKKKYSSMSIEIIHL